MKIKNIIFSFVSFFFLLMLSGVATAEDVQVDLNPPEPLMNESFYVTFHVKVQGDGDPYITFTPSGAQVLGKREQGVSISTVVINGKFTTTKEQNIVYELMAEHAGSGSLRNIKIDIGGKKISLKDVNFNILSAPKKIADAFMEAQVSKTKVYVGEGIDVNYYLYFKTSISANDVKEFPKLNKFIKRFHHVNSPVETVQYKNEVLRRILAYSARVYPEKAGPAVIDPMKISVQVVETDYNGMGGFGLGSQRIKNKDLASNRVEIEVLPLPTENVPPGFTGLVGEHEFNLSAGKAKYLVNEPIELKLEVKGKGALEKLDAPVLYADNNLEAFDTKGEVSELGQNSVKKLFEYTYLARNAFTMKPKDLLLAYFDPNSGKYVEKKISVPGFEVSGVSATSSTTSGKASNTVGSNKNEKTEEGDVASSFLSKFFGNGSSDKIGQTSADGKPIIKNTISLVGPMFSEGSSLSRNIYNILNIIMVVLIGLVFTSYYYVTRDQEVIVSSNKEAKQIAKKLKSKGITYADLYRLLAMLDHKQRLAGGGVGIRDLLNESSLTTEASTYFNNALDVCERSGFGVNKSEQKITYETKYFNELLKIL
jgi:hypothetical protein